MGFINWSAIDPFINHILLGHHVLIQTHIYQNSNSLISLYHDRVEFTTRVIYCHPDLEYKVGQTLHKIAQQNNKTQI